MQPPHGRPTVRRVPRTPAWLAATALAHLAAGCITRGSDWVADSPSEARIARGGQGWISSPPTPHPRSNEAAPPAGHVADGPPEDAAGEDPILVREHGRAARPRPAAAGQRDAGGDVFRNTYYDFPREGGGARDAAIYDAACAPIARVTRAFHDQVCVQGSGRIASGATVSFARRDCACADVCPRTGQRICYERLDPDRFPHGRGALGRAITPLRTVAVDAAVIPLGTRLFIPELVGLPLPDGAPHDGCFVAEDRGIKVVGRQVDIFTGDPAVTARWNALFPSNRGVHVVLGAPRCGARLAAAGAS